MTLWLIFTASACAQVSQDIVVGITPTCPYGLAACAVGAREALKRLEGVRLVADVPDKYNCTFDARLEVADLPDIELWKKQFKEVVGEAFVFRGIEVTIRGTVVDRSGTLVLEAEEPKKPITFAPLENKLQWNFRKTSSRQPEPKEADAHRQLAAECREAPARRAKFEITGPLRSSEQAYVIEVREYFSSKDP